MDIKLKLERVIAFYPQLAKVLGGVEEAIYFQQLYYWHNKGHRKDGYIYKTKEDIESETCISSRKQDRIRKSLESNGFLETKLLKANGSPTIHYKINAKNVQKALNDNEIPNIPKRNNGIYPNGIIQYDETSHSITENTTENTTYNNYNYSVPTEPSDDISKENTDKAYNINQYLDENVYLDDKEPLIKDIIMYYYNTYSEFTNKNHPKIKTNQWVSVVDSINYFQLENMIDEQLWCDMIDMWFNKKNGTDFNIIHFTSGDIIQNCFYKTNEF